MKAQNTLGVKGLHPKNEIPVATLLVPADLDSLQVIVELTVETGGLRGENEDLPIRLAAAAED